MINRRINARTLHQVSRAALVLAPLIVAGVIAGCGEEGHEAVVVRNGGCSVRVIVRHAAEPDSTLLAALELRNSLELEPAGMITNDLQVYTLRAAGGHDACAAAIDRLRRDERVRSVDLDQRRGLHDEP